MSLWSRFSDWFLSTLLDQWFLVKAWVVLFLGAIVLSSVFSVWGESRPVGGFFEELVARSGHYVGVIGAVAGGVFSGGKVFERTRSNFFAWLVGLLCFTVIGGIGMLLLSSIPGVGWRYERLQDSMEIDY